MKRIRLECCEEILYNLKRTSFRFVSVSNCCLIVWALILAKANSQQRARARACVCSGSSRTGESNGWPEKSAVCHPRLVQHHTGGSRAKETPTGGRREWTESRCHRPRGVRCRETGNGTRRTQTHRPPEPEPVRTEWTEVSGVQLRRAGPLEPAGEVRGERVRVRAGEPNL